MSTTVSLEQAQTLKGSDRAWAYNVLDTTGTREIHDTLISRLDKNTALIYGFERALQAPAMSMMMRGARIDVPLRARMVTELKRELERDLKALAKMPEVTAVWDGTETETGFCSMAMGKHHKWPRGVPDAERSCERCHTPRIKKKAFSPISQVQTKHLFYDLLKVPPMKNKTGEISVDEDVLQRIGTKCPKLYALTTATLGIRDKRKQLGSLSARLSSDNRYHSSFNVGAAWTGRFSSSKDPFQNGGNLQNWSERHRKAVISDPGMDVGYADYMQGESNLVAHLSGDERYIQAHIEGDVHTFVTRFVWPELPWTGDLVKDKKIAKQNPPWDLAPGHDYRFQCKRIQHGGNYGLTPQGISMIAHIPLSEARRAYERYMREFDYIPAWQSWIRQQVHEHKRLINPLGRAWIPFGRPWDEHTVKQALSYIPQSALADIDDIALWRVWRHLELQGVELLAQVHDALLFQYPRGNIALVHEMLKLMAIPVPVTDFRGKTRIMTIGVEAALGRNWGHKSQDNPLGIGSTGEIVYGSKSELITS